MLSRGVKFLSTLFGKRQPLQPLHPSQPPQPAQPFQPPPYKPYTTAFDREIAAADLDKVLGPLSPENKAIQKSAWEAFETGLAEWRTRVGIHSLNASIEIGDWLSGAELKDCAITLLIDHSGSMRGQNMLLAAAAADTALDFLSGLGCAVEVLGFTTSSWKGGDSRKLWIRNGWPRWPGRLCDLLHIVYRSADARPHDRGFRGFQPMLRPDLLKENIDGEAIEWAVSRLTHLPHRFKCLIVISDGAPVDDSTLVDNYHAILERHLIEVIRRTKSETAIRLKAIGIGYDVTRYYGGGTVLKTPNDLGSAVVDQIKSALLTMHAPGPRGPAYETLSDHLEDVGVLDVWRDAVAARDRAAMERLLSLHGYTDPVPYIDAALNQEQGKHPSNP